MEILVLFLLMALDGGAEEETDDDEAVSSMSPAFGAETGEGDLILSALEEP